MAGADGPPVSTGEGLCSLSGPRGPKGSITVPAWDSHLAHPCRVTLAEKGQPERRAFR